MAACSDAVTERKGINRKKSIVTVGILLDTQSSENLNHEL
jgi:hypothetical protein